VAVGNRSGSPFAAIQRPEGWTTEPVAKPADTKSSSLSAVSCATSTFCVATGGYSTTTGPEGNRQSLIEVWRGDDWIVESIPQPAAAADASTVTGVSCSSPRYCVAVGEDGASTGVFAETWNGSDWSFRSLPGLEAVFGLGLDGVSCSSPVRCIATGTYGDDESPSTLLAEAWHGKQWRFDGDVPDPDVSDTTTPDGVSCRSATSCMIVASIYPTPSFADVEVDLHWRMVTMAEPEGATVLTFAGLDCSSTTSCMAVGDDEVARVPHLVAEVWDGKSWAITAPPQAPHDSTDAALKGVSCSTSTSCTAVGSATGARGRTLSLAEVWNGRTWTDQAA
jgi:hypothetical protein